MTGDYFIHSNLESGRNSGPQSLLPRKKPRQMELYLRTGFEPQRRKNATTIPPQKNDSGGSPLLTPLDIAKKTAGLRRKKKTGFVRLTIKQRPKGKMLAARIPPFHNRSLIKRWYGLLEKRECSSRLFLDASSGPLGRLTMRRIPIITAPPFRIRLENTRPKTAS